MIKALILDFGGVVFEDKSEHDGPKGSIVPDDELWAKARLGQIDDGAVLDSIAEYYQTDRETVLQWFLSRREPDQRVIAQVDGLRKSGMKVAILNNGLKVLFHALLDHYGLKSHFDVLVNSAEEGIEKPDAEIYLRTAARLGVKPRECLCLDDAQANVKGAISAGMKANLFKKGMLLLESANV